MERQRGRRGIGFWRAAFVAVAGVHGVVADSILQTSSFSNCGPNSNIQVKKVDIQYNNDNKTVVFNVAGSSNKVQNVTATLNVTAYGNQVYSNSFDPCFAATFVKQLCPVPAGEFAAQGSQAIPAAYADMVPSIAFQIPDIAAQATLELKAKDSGQNVACIQSQVSNGKTASVPAVSYIAAGIAGAALVLGGVTAVGSVLAGGSAAGGSAAGGAGTLSPSFGEVFGFFQGMAMNGMHSVNYPLVYRSFSKNFGFSTGLIPWTAMQTTIDNFRASTGGNLTNNSVQFLQNATLTFNDGSSSSGTAKAKRAFELFAALASREISTSVNSTASGSSGSGGSGPAQSIQTAVHGIQGYVEQLSIPSGNTFMTVLLIVAIAIAAIAVGILLVKVVLEIWALFATFPKALTGFREHYWGSIARAITTLIFLLYGIWVLYCVFQFTQGDSWAAKALAGATLGVFTAVLGFFSYKIWSTARKLKRTEGDASALYEDKSIWVKYSLFYDSYKKDYWWLFVPTIVYMFVKGVALAVGDGRGMAQTIAQLVIESVMFALLLWSRPYERRSGNVINIAIQVVRVLSVVCILVFVEEFGIRQTTQTIAGVVLIAVQSALTGILAILIIWNVFIACCKANPHRKRRKEMEKMRDLDTLTPLDARNSLLNLGKVTPESFSIANTGFGEKPRAPPSRGSSPDKYAAADLAGADIPNPYAPRAPVLGGGNGYRPLTPSTPGTLQDQPVDHLVGNAAPFGRADLRQPTLPNVGYGSGGPYQRNMGYAPPPTGPYGGGGGGGGGYSQGGYGYGGGQWRGPPSRGGY